jgi:GcrA cell cycle regulator
MTKMSNTSKQRKTVQTLDMHDCRWPIGDPQHADFHFCGARRVAGRPYCAAHVQAAIQPAKPRYPQAQQQPAVAEPLRRAA